MPARQNGALLVKTCKRKPVVEVDGPGFVHSKIGPKAWETRLFAIVWGAGSVSGDAMRDGGALPREPAGAQCDRDTKMAQRQAAACGMKRRIHADATFSRLSWRPKSRASIAAEGCRGVQSGEIGEYGFWRMNELLSEFVDAVAIASGSCIG